jgi:hypothetical protein
MNIYLYIYIYLFIYDTYLWVGKHQPEMNGGRVRYSGHPAVIGGFNPPKLFIKWDHNSN